MSETSTIVTPLLEALNAIPYVWARRLHSGTVKVRGGYMHLGDAGAPDCLAIVRGVPVLLEAKLAKGLVTHEQLRVHGFIRRAGGHVHVVRSVREGVQIVREILSNTSSESADSGLCKNAPSVVDATTGRDLSDAAKRRAGKR